MYENFGIALTEFGDENVLRWMPLPTPEVNADSVLIEVEYSSVNPTDLMLRRGQKPESTVGPPPWVPGMDIVGRVVKKGTAVASKFALGDRVMALHWPVGANGGYSRLVAATAGACAIVPEGANIPSAATLPLNGVTALRCLRWVRPRPGEVVALSGPRGAIGCYVRQLARASGVKIAPIFSAGALSNPPSSPTDTASRDIELAIDAGVVAPRLVKLLPGLKRIALLRPPPSISDLNCEYTIMGVKADYPPSMDINLLRRLWAAGLIRPLAPIVVCPKSPGSLHSSRAPLGRRYVLDLNQAQTELDYGSLPSVHDGNIGRRNMS